MIKFVVELGVPEYEGIDCGQYEFEANDAPEAAQKVSDMLERNPERFNIQKWALKEMEELGVSPEVLSVWPWSPSDKFCEPIGQ
jgi:hypothetical protein